MTMATQQDAWRPVTPWTVIAAILLPPLGIFLSRGLTPALMACCAVIPPTGPSTRSWVMTRP